MQTLQKFPVTNLTKGIFFTRNEVAVIGNQ